LCQTLKKAEVEFDQKLRESHLSNFLKQVANVTHRMLTPDFLRSDETAPDLFLTFWEQPERNV
jgi:hypothetical protein